MAKKVLITGASTYGVKNHGDDAMLSVLVSELKLSVPDIEITFLCRHPDREYDKIFGFTSLKNVDHDSAAEAKGRFFYGFNKGDNRDGLLKIICAIQEADLVIIGGNSLMEISANEFLRGVSSYAALIAMWSLSFCKPYALYGINIVEPIVNITTQKHAKFLVENAEVVTAREQHVVEYLENVNISSKNIKVCGDPVFGLKAPEISDLPKNMKEHFLNWRNSKKILIGFNFRIEYWVCSKKRRDFILNNLAKVIEELIYKQDAQFLLIPNCTYAEGDRWQDDRNTNEAILKAISPSASEEVFSIENENNIFETIRIFNELDFHITNRRHSALFAVLKGVPFSLYDVGLKSHISPLISELNLNTKCISVDLDPEEQVSQIVRNISVANTIVEQTNSILPTLAKRSKDQVKLISDLL